MGKSFCEVQIMNILGSLLEGAGELIPSGEITPTRSFNLLYIILDTIFILVFLGCLIWKKRYATAIFALFGGILYTIVDFGGFYLSSHTRQVLIDGVVQGPMNTFWVLLWMSMSYGITNFAFMWVCVRRDKYLKIWLTMIITWWLMCPSIAELGGEARITTMRTTGAYHGWMAVALVVSYAILIFFLLKSKKEKPFVDIAILFLIGFAVQFSWEFALLINGIRPMNELSLKTIIVNSFLETNLGMPLCYLITYLFGRKFNEDLTKVEAK